MIEAKAEEILRVTSHRYYSLPGKRWKYFQQWADTVMLHWEVDPGVIKEALPQGIYVETFDGKAWLSLVIFSVRNMHLWNFRMPDFIGAFEEVNFRTYVEKDGISGIYMFSVETDKAFVKWALRIFSGIPYTKAQIDRYRQSVCLKHISKGFFLDIDYTNSRKLCAKTPLDVWLTERHCLYETIGRKWYRYDIHHKPWPLEDCAIKTRALQYDIGRFSTAGKMPDRVHFSGEIDVLLWPRKKLKK
jgi:uncharacterized protein